MLPDVPAALAVLADIHLGLPGAPGIDGARELLSRARDTGARSLIIAGDLIDRAEFSDATFEEAAALIAEARATFSSVDFIAGNHDVHHRLEFPPEVRVHGTEVHSFTRAGIVVHTAAVATDPDPRRLVGDFPVRPQEDVRPHVGILHTSVEGQFSRKPCLPTTPEELLSRGYAAWILGHVHNGATLREADPYIGWVGMGYATIVDSAGRFAAKLG